MSDYYNICQFMLGAALSKKDQPGWKHRVPESSFTEGSYTTQIQLIINIKLTLLNKVK